MIKRIIFDVDNTLIMWKKEYNETYKYALDELGINYTDQDIDNLDKIVDTYDKNFDYFNKKDMINYINNNSIINLPDNFIDIWMKYLCNCYCEEDKKVIKVLDYLSNKYELVVLSNWFSYSQIERLKNLKIDNYFKELIFTEEVKNKPNKEAFIKACGNYNPSECVMIGDNLEVDIKGAIKAGLNAILYDKNNKYDYDNKIKDLEELEELL